MNATLSMGRKAIRFAVVVSLLAFVIILVAPSQVATAPKPARFLDNGDGTITDTRTGLMWSKTTGTSGSGVVCSTNINCTDPTNVNNLYTWSSSGTEPDGTLFSDFLASMNCSLLRSGGTCGVGVHHDWRIPTVAEWNTIVDCSFSPCLDPVFGPTASVYWSFTSYYSTTLHSAFEIHFDGVFAGQPGGEFKTLTVSARAVRG